MEYSDDFEMSSPISEELKPVKQHLQETLDPSSDVKVLQVKLSLLEEQSRSEFDLLKHQRIKYQLNDQTDKIKAIQETVIFIGFSWLRNKKCWFDIWLKEKRLCLNWKDLEPNQKRYF
jgi:hypothetical protein